MRVCCQWGPRGLGSPRCPRVLQRGCEASGTPKRNLAHGRGVWGVFMFGGRVGKREMLGCYCGYAEAVSAKLYLARPADAGSGPLAASVQSLRSTLVAEVQCARASAHRNSECPSGLQDFLQSGSIPSTRSCGHLEVSAPSLGLSCAGDMVALLAFSPRTGLCQSTWLSEALCSCRWLQP